MSAPRGGARSHLYCSPNNIGARDMIKEAVGLLHCQPPIVSNSSSSGAERFVLYLDANTWTSHLAPRLAKEVTKAMMLGMDILLLHESDASTDRAVAFGIFFQVTPPHLIRWGLYGKVALAVHGDEHRCISLALIVREITGWVWKPRQPRPELALDVEPDLATPQQGPAGAEGAGAEEGDEEEDSDSEEDGDAKQGGAPYQMYAGGQGARPTLEGAGLELEAAHSSRPGSTAMHAAEDEARERRKAQLMLPQAHRLPTPDDGCDSCRPHAGAVVVGRASSGNHTFGTASTLSARGGKARVHMRI